MLLHAPAVALPPACPLSTSACYYFPPPSLPLPPTAPPDSNSECPPLAPKFIPPPPPRVKGLACSLPVEPLEGPPQALAGDPWPHCCQAAGLEDRRQWGLRVGFARSRGRGLPSASRGWQSGLTRGLAGLTRKRHSWRSSCCEPARGTVGRLVPRAASGAGLSAGASQGCATLVCMLSLHYAI